MFFSPPKLEDCINHGPGSELLIVEGDSAARAINVVRSKDNQAVWPMQGKPMNALKADKNDILDNVQFSGLIHAAKFDLTTGLEADEMRYERFLLLFDPDADGIHARTLMLFFFYKHLRPILDAGRVFDSHAPRWRIESSAIAKPAYAYTEEHLQAIRDRLDEAKVSDVRVTPFRGLGSVGGDALRKFCLDPETRRVNPLGAEDAEQAISVFENMRLLGRGLSPDENR